MNSFITPTDLLNLGLKPSPLTVEILVAADEQALKGKIRTRDEALEYAREYLYLTGNIKD